jgi:hypothetical protein
MPDAAAVPGERLMPTMVTRPQRLPEVSIRCASGPGLLGPRRLRLRRPIPGTFLSDLNQRASDSAARAVLGLQAGARRSGDGL